MIILESNDPRASQAVKIYSEWFEVFPTGRWKVRNRSELLLEVTDSLDDYDYIKVGESLQTVYSEKPFFKYMWEWMVTRKCPEMIQKKEMCPKYERRYLYTIWAHEDNLRVSDIEVFNCGD